MIHGWNSRHARALAVARPSLARLPQPASAHPNHPRLDTNGDGSVDLAEMQARHPDYTADKFNAADTDHNGLLSREELRGLWEHREHPAIDTDGDGKLSYDELKKVHPDLTQQA